jgi:hypothetical protein
MSRLVPKEIRRILDEAGVPWDLREGGKHRHLYVCGERVCVFPRGAQVRDAGRTLHNTIAEVRRFLRGRT